MATPINPNELEFVTREYFLNGGENYASGQTLTFQQLDTTLIFLSNSIATAGTSFVGLTTASANLNIINFSKSDGTTFSITVDTGSAITVNTSSLLLTASATLNTIEFTKGDGTTKFYVTIDTGSAITINTGSLLLTASANLNTITFTKGDNTTQFSITVDTGSGQTYTAGDGIDITDNEISSKVLTVNLQGPIEGNIPLSITNTITGPSSSLSGSPYFLPDTYSPRPPVSGTIFVVSGDIDADKNGNAYIFVTSSAQPGSWQQIFGFNETTADARYVRLSATSTQNITSSLRISGSTTFSGSLLWSGSSDANGATANVVVLSNGQLYITGAYGSGGGTSTTPGVPLNSIQYNNNNNFAGSSNLTFNGSTVNLSGSLISSGSTPLRVIGPTTFSGSLFWSGSSDLGGAANNVLVLDANGQIYRTGSYSIGGGGSGTPGTPLNSIQFNNNSSFGGSANLTFINTNTVNLTGSLIASGSTPLRAVGISTFTGSVIISSSLRVIGTGSITGSVIISRSIEGTPLSVIGTGSSPILNVVGSTGNLLQAYDRISGDLFAVGDYPSGLPILKVTSNRETFIGNSSAPGLYNSFITSSVNAGNHVVYQVLTSSYNALWIDYSAYSGSDFRAGTFNTMWSGSTIRYIDITGSNFGNTNNLTFTSSFSSSYLQVTSSIITTNGWFIKGIIRVI
jgi:hypothetical protein